MPWRRGSASVNAVHLANLGSSEEGRIRIELFFYRGATDWAVPSLVGEETGDNARRGGGRPRAATRGGRIGRLAVESSGDSRRSEIAARTKPARPGLTLRSSDEPSADAPPVQSVSVRSPRGRSGRRALPPPSSRHRSPSSPGRNGARTGLCSGILRISVQRQESRLRNGASKPVAEHGSQFCGLVNGGDRQLSGQPRLGDCNESCHAGAAGWRREHK
jgi:hypothetical protein